jgi:drug/metabolite transporter (DMT)-like permease
MLLALAAIWGSSFMFIKIAVREVEPGFLVVTRLWLAAITLAFLVSRRLPLREAWRQIRGLLLPLALVGVAGSLVPFWLLSWGETRIDSSLAALLQSATPLFTAVLVFLFLRSQHAGGMRLVGVLIGFGGVALLVGAPGGGDTLAALAIVGVALCYSVGVLFTSKIRGATPLAIALGSTCIAALLSTPFAVLDRPGSMPGWKTIVSILVLGIVGLGVAYVLYFVLIVRAGASKAVLVTYLVPPLALAYGAVFLDEPLRWPALGGLALVLTGVALGSGVLRLPARKAAPTAV